ncbi:unnamed protein product [Brachionus calyciflorus]|uniref:Lysosomal-associated transmembrane protein 4A n=1 Tax=Brachionus calyciflorus TaxID=104777 RepID=A0A814B9Y9_9BILA|nr:unnamed protein product [Brachionus calyciflorus]
MTKAIFCCLKIKSATLLIGILDLFLHIILLTSLLTSWSHPSIFDHYYTNSFNLMSSPSSNCQIISARNGFMDSPTALPYGEASNLIQHSKNHKRNIDIPSQFGYPNQFSNNSNNYLLPNKSIYVLITLFSTLIITMLIYGIVKNKPSYLMPYFSIKVFQVVMATLTTLSFYTCLPNVRLWIQSQNYFPLKYRLLAMDNHSLDLFVFSILLASILAKFYIVIIVWYCYRHMITLESFRSNSYISSGNAYFEESNTGVKFDEESFMSLPPKYEEVIKDCQVPITSSLIVEQTNEIENETASQVPTYSQAISSKNGMINV